MLHRDRKWPTSEWLMEKKLFKNSEKVTVQQEAAKNLSQASICVGVLGNKETAWTISNTMLRVKQLTSTTPALCV